ncbi:hypothetical protein [Paraburkholderia sp. LEh10]|uniref:hypothetical protein n=1 Tax=Paraburkholderia sp. LEh10 TaxID=2821353 RepID=UPI001FD86896|nr:hypothetical protein [Paraburkholderia sp. LEh10]
MTQRLAVYQSLWAMERRHTDGFERSLEDNVAMIAQAGFEGVSTSYESREVVRRLAQALAPYGLQAEAQCFARTVEDLCPVLEHAVESGAHHIDLQPDVSRDHRPRRQRYDRPLGRIADDARLDTQAVGRRRDGRCSRHSGRHSGRRGAHARHQSISGRFSRSSTVTGIC